MPADAIANQPLHPGDEAFISQLETYGRLVFSSVGNSMFPMLRGSRDVMVLKKIERPLKRLDVALYRDPQGKYVLHRVLKASGDAVVFCGDGCLNPDPPVNRGDVLAVLEGFYRGKRYFKARGALCMFYARVWCADMRLRRPLLSVCYRLQKIKIALAREK